MGWERWLWRERFPPPLLLCGIFRSHLMGLVTAGKLTGSVSHWVSGQLRAQASFQRAVELMKWELISDCAQKPGPVP